MKFVTSTCVAFAAVGVFHALACATARDVSPSDENRPSYTDAGGSTIGRKRFKLPDEVSVEVEAWLLPKVELKDGSILRGMSLASNFHHSGAYMGGARLVRMLPVASKDPIDLSFADTDPEHPFVDETKISERRQGISYPGGQIGPSYYEVTATPRGDLTWGDVHNFEYDVVVVALPAR